MISNLMFQKISKKSAECGLTCSADQDSVTVKMLDSEIRISSIGTSLSIVCTDGNIFNKILERYASIHCDEDELKFVVAEEDIMDFIDVFEQCTFNNIVSDPVFSSPDIEKIESTESEAKTKLRKGQAWLRSRAMIYWNNSCALTGINTSKILETCHIKPWSDPHTTARERLSVENTIVMCVHFHRLFDAGLISFTDDGALLISPKLSPENASRLGLAANMRIIRSLEKKQKEFLDYHRKNIFKS